MANGNDFSFKAEIAPLFLGDDIQSYINTGNYTSEEIEKIRKRLENQKQKIKTAAVEKEKQEVMIN